VIKKESLISYKFILIYLGIFGILLFGRIGAIALIIFAIFYSFIGVDASIKALTFSFIIVFVNPKIFGEINTSIVTALRQVFIIVLFFSTIFHLVFSNRGIVVKLTLLLFCIVAGVLGIMSSYSVPVTILKIINFFLGASVIIALYFKTKKSKDYWVKWFISLAVLVSILSIAVIPFENIAYKYNGYGTNYHLLMGITKHSQVLSIFMSPFIGFLIGKIYEKGFRLNYVLLLCLFVITLFLTKGRTGMFSIILSLLILIFITIFSKRYRKITIEWLKSTTNTIVLSVVLLIGIIFYNQIFNVVSAFVLKREETKNVKESFETSRLGQILKVTKNISDSPYTGIGFGMPSFKKSLKKKLVKDPFFHIPISAATEKGFLPLAIVEETGIVGTIFFLLFLITFLGRIYKNAPVSIFLFSLVSFTNNFGEMMFFSFGGIGLMMWLLMGIGLIKEKKEEIVSDDDIDQEPEEEDNNFEPV